MALDTLDGSEPSSGLLAALTSGSGGGSGSSSDALGSGAQPFWPSDLLTGRRSAQAFYMAVPVSLRDVATVDRKVQTSSPAAQSRDACLCRWLQESWC